MAATRPASPILTKVNMSGARLAAVKSTISLRRSTARQREGARGGADAGRAVRALVQLDAAVHHPADLEGNQAKPACGNARAQASGWSWWGCWCGRWGKGRGV